MSVDIDGCSRGDECSMGMGVPGGWVFQGGECSRGMSVLGDECLGGWEFLIPSRNTIASKKVNGQGHRLALFTSVHKLISE